MHALELGIQVPLLPPMAREGNRTAVGRKGGIVVEVLIKSLWS